MLINRDLHLVQHEDYWESDLDKVIAWSKDIKERLLLLN